MKAYFEGWYYKQQADGRTLALIPGRSADGAFVQIITERASYNVQYPLSQYRNGNVIRVGDSTFCPDGVALNIQSGEVTLTGELRYTNLTPIRGDIMGPFRFFPMECRHGVTSMRHEVKGTLQLNGEPLDFSGGVGYIELDCGTSFPDAYTWVQCNVTQHCSIMASVARIPFCGMRFWGCICVVWLKGIEYRLATYRGVKIVRREPGVLELKQGDLRLEVHTQPTGGQQLAAPRRGSMHRTVTESASCPATFRFTKGGEELFAGESLCASYEHFTEQK